MTLSETKEREIKKLKQDIAAENADAYSSLDKALQALKVAKTALQDLDKSDVTEIRYILNFLFYLFIS